MSPVWAAGKEIRLRLLQTTDLHMNLLNHDYYQDRSTQQYGLAKTIPLIEQARQEQPNSLLFDNGDLIQGNPLGDVVAAGFEGVHPAYRVMNHLRYDAANIGNHEFNYGLDFLQRSIRGAKFPVLNANVVQPGTERPLFRPSALLTRTFKDTTGRTHRLRIGVLGLTPPQIMVWDRQHLQRKAEALDMVAVAAELVPKLRQQGADVVVVIAHTGIDLSGRGSTENTALALAQLPGVDALLLGHAHAEFPGPQFAKVPGADISQGTLHGVATVMPGRWGDHLGVVDMRLQRKADRWQVVEQRGSLRQVDERTSPLPAKWIAVEHAATLQHVRSKVAESERPLHSFFAQVQDSLSVELVARAQAWHLALQVRGTPLQALPILSASAPFRSGGRQGAANYTDIAPGVLTRQHVADLYVYPNTFKALKLTGAEVREWLEMAAGQFRTIDPNGPPEQELLQGSFPSFNFDTLEGVEYDIDATQPARYNAQGDLVDAAARRVLNLRWQGQPLKDDQQFLVATNNYRAYGGGKFPGLGADKVVVDSGVDNRELLADYLRQQKRITEPADQNWRLLPVRGVALRFHSSALAKDQVQAPVRWVRDNGDGLATYEVAPAAP